LKRNDACRFSSVTKIAQALKVLKKKMQHEGIFRDMKLRGRYEKPSEKKPREKAEARKLARKKCSARIRLSAACGR